MSCRNCGHVFRIGDSGSTLEATTRLKTAANPNAGGDRWKARPVGSHTFVRKPQSRLIRWPPPNVSRGSPRRSSMKLTLLLVTPCLLVALVGGIASLTINNSFCGARSNDRCVPRRRNHTDRGSGAAPDRRPVENPVDTTQTAEATNDTWKIGELVMAQWSGDEYWYPARIEKQVGDQFEIKHLDGTEDTVTADKLAKDTLQAGDRVSANWRYDIWFSGKIVSRVGNEMQILFADGEELNKTMAAVRLWPNGEPDDGDDQQASYVENSGDSRNHVAEYQAYLNAEAELHRMYAARARQDLEAIQAEAQQMQSDIMNRQYYEGLKRLNNAVPGFQPFPYYSP